MRWIADRRGLFVAATPARIARPGWAALVLGPAAFLGSVPLYPVIGAWTFAVWAVVPNLPPLLRRLRGRSDSR